jgi:hypothetical protein
LREPHRTLAAIQKQLHKSIVFAEDFFFNGLQLLFLYIALKHEIHLINK